MNDSELRKKIQIQINFLKTLSVKKVNNKKKLFFISVENSNSDNFYKEKNKPSPKLISNNNVRPSKKRKLEIDWNKRFAELRKNISKDKKDLHSLKKKVNSIKLFKKKI